MTTPRTRNQKSPQPKVQSFQAHLQELRTRLLWYTGFLVSGTILGYTLHTQILDILIRPLNQPIFYVSPAGGFDFVLKISLFFGFLISLPILMYHSVRFIEPALPKRLPRLLLTVLITSSILLLLGMGFAYFVSLPAALYFLGKFATGDIKAMISTTEYFSFVTRYLIGFGLVFQLPLVMIATNSVQKIPTKTLLKYERLVILVSFVTAAVLTPTPDIFNQLIMALPIIVLYQLTVIAVWVINSRKRTRYLDLPHKKV